MTIYDYETDYVLDSFGNPILPHSEVEIAGQLFKVKGTSVDFSPTYMIWTPEGERQRIESITLDVYTTDGKVSLKVTTKTYLSWGIQVRAA